MVNQPIYSIHCMAHKLHLAIGKSFKRSIYFREHFEKTVDSIVRFYNFHSSKRKGHLSDTSKEFDMKLYDIHFIHDGYHLNSKF